MPVQDSIFIVEGKMRLNTGKAENRFDYVAYDEQSKAIQQHAKIQVQCIENTINELGHSRYTALALNALEECYMWIGKSIRDDQIIRNGKAQLQEERSDS